MNHYSYDDMILLTQILAANGDVPANVGGWRLHEGRPRGALDLYADRNGVLGEVMEVNGLAFVCVSPCLDLMLPNTHPDYRPVPATVWAAVPEPDQVDWRYVPQQYHRRDGWRVRIATT